MCACAHLPKSNRNASLTKGKLNYLSLPHKNACIHLLLRQQYVTKAPPFCVYAGLPSHYPLSPLPLFHLHPRSEIINATPAATLINEPRPLDDACSFARRHSWSKWYAPMLNNIILDYLLYLAVWEIRNTGIIYKCPCHLLASLTLETVPESITVVETTDTEASRWTQLFCNYLWPLTVIHVSVSVSVVTSTQNKLWQRNGNTQDTEPCKSGCTAIYSKFGWTSQYNL